jgi:hypothetical protein
VDGLYYAPDYGRLKQIGQWIEDETWKWETDRNGGTTSDWVIAMQHGFLLYAWQTLMWAQPWYVQQGQDGPADPNYPPRFTFDDGKSWFSVSYYFTEHYPNFDSMAALFDPVKVVENPFPLAVPLADVFRGNHGWPYSPSASTTNPPSANPPEPKPRLSLGVDLTLSASLSREAGTGELVATVTLNNLGMTTATNVDISDASIDGRHALANHARQQMRVHQGFPQTFRLRFPNIPKGKKAVMRVTGKYLGGTFGASFRVTLP